MLKPQQRDEVKSESNPIPSYGLPSAPPLQEPVQTYKNVDTLYGAPPAAPREYDYSSSRYPSQTYQSSYQDAVPANLIRKRAVIKGIDLFFKGVPSYHSIYIYLPKFDNNILQNLYFNFS